jgi:hypothetical protein
VTRSYTVIRCVANCLRGSKRIQLMMSIDLQYKCATQQQLLNVLRLANNPNNSLTRKALIGNTLVDVQSLEWLQM